MPGSRWLKFLMALKVWVALVAPAAMPERAWAAVALVWPRLTRTPRLVA